MHLITSSLLLLVGLVATASTSVSAQPLRQNQIPAATVAHLLARQDGLPDLLGVLGIGTSTTAASVKTATSVAEPTSATGGVGRASSVAIEPTTTKTVDEERSVHRQEGSVRWRSAKAADGETKEDNMGGAGRRAGPGLMLDSPSILPLCQRLPRQVHQGQSTLNYPTGRIPNHSGPSPPDHRRVHLASDDCRRRRDSLLLALRPGRRSFRPRHHRTVHHYLSHRPRPQRWRSSPPLLAQTRLRRRVLHSHPHGCRLSAPYDRRRRKPHSRTLPLRPQE